MCNGAALSFVRFYSILATELTQVIHVYPQPKSHTLQRQTIKLADISVYSSIFKYTLYELYGNDKITENSWLVKDQISN